MKLACILTDGFEDVEALATSALLRRAGFTVDFCSVHNKKLVTGSYQTAVAVTKSMVKVNVKNYEGVFIPGGRAVYSIRNDKGVRDIVREFYEADKWMLAICAAPTVYGMLGIMDGKNYTSFPGTEKEMNNAIRIDKKVVRDGKFITARSVADVYEFVFEIIEAIRGKEALAKFKENIVY